MVRSFLILFNGKYDFKKIKDIYTRIKYYSICDFKKNI